jgi:hypothetical protein
MARLKLIPLQIVESSDQSVMERDEALVRQVFASSEHTAVRKSLHQLKIMPLDLRLTEDGSLGRTPVRLASATVMEREAARQGLQSLYADPKEALEQYKDFDLVKAILERGDAKLLWFRARAIDADTVNANGDYFSKEELLKETVYNGKKVPAYKTFEGVPLYTNHENQDITKAKGCVVYAEWDEKDNCVYTVSFVDEEAYPDIARGVRMGYMLDVSMGCKVKWGECSECANKAYHEGQYCQHLKQWKGKTNPTNGKKVYEYNFGLQFIELSIVGDGAFDLCAIKELYDSDELLNNYGETKKKAGDVLSRIVAAERQLAGMPETSDAAIWLRAATEGAIAASRIANSAGGLLRRAQVGPLVGGETMAQPGANGNTTVSKILQYLGMDSKASLNVLDMLNLSLNFMEVGILNLLSKKDNLDLTHVSKISKAMADLQNTMQDMLDDGIDATTPSAAGLLLNGGQGAQAPTMQQDPSMDYSSTGSGVGRVMGPQMQGTPAQPPSLAQQAAQAPQQPRQAYNHLPPVRTAGSKSELLKVASRHRDKERGADKFAESLTSLANALGQTQLGTAVKTANGAQPVKRTAPASGRPPILGGTNKMTWQQKMAHNLTEQAGDTMERSIRFFDNEGHSVEISESGQTRGFFRGVQASEWKPRITRAHIELLQNEREGDFGQSILADFQHWVKTSSCEDLNGAHNTPLGEQLSTRHKGAEDNVKDALLENNAGAYKHRHLKGDKTREELLDSESYDLKRGKTHRSVILEEALENCGLFGRRGADDDVKEALLEDAHVGNPTGTIERQMDERRPSSGDVDVTKLVGAVVGAAANSVVTAGVTPEEVIEAAERLASRNDLDELIAIASLGTEARERFVERFAFHNGKSPLIGAENALIHELGKNVGAFGASDLSDAVTVLASDVDQAARRVTAAAKARIAEANAQASEVIVRPTKQQLMKAALAAETTEKLNRDHLRQAVYACAAACEKCGAHPSEVIEAAEEYDAQRLASEIELFRSPDLRGAREKAARRAELFGTRTASAQNLSEEMVIALADHAEESGFSSASVAKAVMKLASTPNAAMDVIGTAMEDIRTAALTVTEESCITKRVTCTLADLGNLDPKDPGFVDSFREAAIKALQDAGHQIDPSTFTFTNLTIGPSGDVSAETTSRVSKTYQAEANPFAGGSNFVSIEAAEDQMGADNSEPRMRGIGVDDEVMTPSAQILARANRGVGGMRIAQMMPGMGAAPMGGAPMGGAPMDPMAAGPMGGDAGLASLTIPSESGAPGTGMLPGEFDADGMAEPGSKKPFGSVCPQCGSIDTEIAGNHGKCNVKECGAQWDIEYSIHMTDDGTGTKGSDDEEEPMDAESLGLGGATAPAPTDPMAGGGFPMDPMAGAPPAAGANLVASVWWQGPAAPFVKIAAAAQQGMEREARMDSLELPGGYICLSCGNRNPDTLEKIACNGHSKSFCGDCGQMLVSKNPHHRELPDGRRLAAKAGHVWNNVMWLGYVESLD